MTIKTGSFAEIYCESHQLDRSDFSNRIIRRSLHFPIRLVGWLLLSIKPNYFEADLELITHAGSLKSSRMLEQEIRQFNADYRNQSFWRGPLRQRISTRRLRKLFRKTMTASGEDLTPPPFPAA